MSILNIFLYLHHNLCILLNNQNIFKFVDPSNILLLMYILHKFLMFYILSIRLEVNIFYKFLNLLDLPNIFDHYYIVYILLKIDMFYILIIYKFNIFLFDQYFQQFHRLKLKVDFHFMNILYNLLKLILNTKDKFSNTIYITIDFLLNLDLNMFNFYKHIFHQ